MRYFRGRHSQVAPERGGVLRPSVSANTSVPESLILRGFITLPVTSWRCIIILRCATRVLSQTDLSRQRGELA